MRTDTMSLFKWNTSCRFWTGTHVPNWLSKWGPGLFVSRRTLSRYKTPPRSIAPWALDSGGFTELAMFGKWTISARDYADTVRMLSVSVGNMEWAASQDWMCEDKILARTGKTVREHQELSVRSFLELMSIAPDLPWIPVVQGRDVADYLRCADMYDKAGVSLGKLPIVGVGSVCRRQHSAEAYHIFAALHHRGLKLHGFGLKMRGLEAASHLMVSADSLAWSYAARRSQPMPGHTHKNCANCMEYAKMWRRKVLSIHGVVGAVQDAG